MNYSILEQLSTKNIKGLQKYACLLLNLSDSNFKLFDKYQYIWNNASFKVAVDGSANLLWRNNILPTADIVCGDLDSIDSRIVDWLRRPVVKSATVPKLIETPEQNETDFTKALTITMSLEPQISNFITLYYNDGSRMDHIFGLVNTLHKKSTVKKKVYLINVKSGTVSWLLHPGVSFIHKQPGREFCSLVPFSGSAEVTANGLEYNMKKTNLCFRGPLSICNISQNDSKIINVETDNTLLWSIELKN